MLMPPLVFTFSFPPHRRAVLQMGMIKEYVDIAIQTEADTAPSPYADPAVVLAAPPVARRRVAPEVHASGLSPTGSTAQKSPFSPIFSPLVSRRLSKRKLAQHPAGETVNRRIASMPENMAEPFAAHSTITGKRVVSMPDRVRPALEPSVELFQSPTTAAGDSFESFSGHRERIRVYPVSSDIPQTPSPPSSPESLLIIAAGTQLPEGFLRRRYSPEPFIEEEEDWITWANSPPRPIPALHGPLSLPYARCPSGAEGTIIEEPDNVAQMIWGLGPDDQPHNHIRAEGFSSLSDNAQNAFWHGSSQVPPRLQKKKTSTQQIHKLSRTQISPHANHSTCKPGFMQSQRQANDDKRCLRGQISLDVETRQDSANILPWNETLSVPPCTTVPDDPSNESDAFPINNNRVLELQLARLRHALRTSLVDMDSYTTYPGRLEPVIPASVAPGLPQSYPRIFVEPRPNEPVSSTGKRQSSTDLAQQYRQQQLYRQALQKQKLRSILPTPPNSSSPQWSSQFSPYLAYCSTFSPELVGPVEHLASIPLQKLRSGANASEYLRHVHDQHEYDINELDTRSTTIPNIKTAQTISQAASFGSSSSSSSTLAKYIKKLQALSPVANFPTLHPASPPLAPLTSLPSIDQDTVGALRTVYHPPAFMAPPSPESPRTGASFQNSRSVLPARSAQRCLSSVPEEEGILSEASVTVSSSRLQQGTVDNISLGATGRQMCYLEVPPSGTLAPNLPELESHSEVAPLGSREMSPVKVRLPGNKAHNVREQVNGKEGHQHGHRKKHRYKKLKGPNVTNDQAATRGLAG